MISKPSVTGVKPDIVNNTVHFIINILIQHVWQNRKAEKANKEILSLSHTPSFQAKAADAAPSSPPLAWMADLAVGVLWFQTPFSPL